MKHLKILLLLLSAVLLLTGCINYISGSMLQSDRAEAQREAFIIKYLESKYGGAFERTADREIPQGGPYDLAVNTRKWSQKFMCADLGETAIVFVVYEDGGYRISSDNYLSAAFGKETVSFVNELLDSVFDEYYYLRDEGEDNANYVPSRFEMDAEIPADITFDEFLEYASISDNLVVRDSVKYTAEEKLRHIADTAKAKNLRYFSIELKFADDELYESGLTRDTRHPDSAVLMWSRMLEARISYSKIRDEISFSWRDADGVQSSEMP